MSKKDFKKAVQASKVIALPTRVVKNAKGEVVKTLYNIYKA